MKKSQDPEWEASVANVSKLLIRQLVATPALLQETTEHLTSMARTHHSAMERFAGKRFSRGYVNFDGGRLSWKRSGLGL